MLSFSKGRVTVKECVQVERTAFGSSVKLVNAESNTVLRSCGLHEAVRDTVPADTSPAARWNLVPCEGGAWFSLRPASDESEVRPGCNDCVSPPAHMQQSYLLVAAIMHAAALLEFAAF